MSGSSYNAVSWLLDRNIDEGRGAKLAYTDTVSELTYRGLQQQKATSPAPGPGKAPTKRH